MADDRLAICRHTAPPHAAHAVLRILDQGRASGRFVSLITSVGPREHAQDLARELVRERPSSDVDVVGQDALSTTLRVSTPVDGQDAGQARLLAVLRLFERLGSDAWVEPIILREGRVRARLIVPRPMDPAAVHAAVAEAQAQAGFRELRLSRVARLDPERHVEVMRPLLTPEQDVLLRLAMAMGYYANPKRATLEDISTRVGLSISPIHKRLKAAEEMLVGAHVGGASRPSPAPRRRPRRRAQPLALRGGACELDLVARAPTHPVARFAAEHRGARVLLLPQGEDPRSSSSRWLVLATGPRQQTDALRAALRAEPGLVLEEVASEDAHACVRVLAPVERGWGTSAFSAAFGGGTLVRRLVFEGDEVYARLVLPSAGAVDDLEGRLGKVLAQLGWRDHDVLAVLDAVAERVPEQLPEPLSARQEEVLKVAHALGYYRTPRGCTLEQVASTLGVSANAIHKNLVGAEARIISHYLSGGF